VRKLSTVWAAVAVPFLAACGQGDARQGGGFANWQVDSATVLEIGQVEGDSAYQLYRVRDIVELADGSVAIANSGTNQVRIYDAQGRYVRSLGRSGDGPGEFQMLLDLRARGDTIHAYDRLSGRLTRFLASGQYLGDVVLRSSAAMMTPTFSGLLRDGASVGWIIQIPAERPDGFQRHIGVLLRIAADGVDTLGSFPGPEMILRTREAPGGGTVMQSTSLDFYRTFLAIAAGDRSYAGSTDSALINVWDASGKPLAPIRWDDAPGPVDDALVAASLDREIRGLEPQAARARRELVEESPRPATAPVFDRLRLGPDGDVGRRYARDRGGGGWYSPDGSVLARVRLRGTNQGSRPRSRLRWSVTSTTSNTAAYMLQLSDS
jgi:hypothetical protein